MHLQGGWGLLGLGVDDVRVRLLPDVVAEQAEMFLINGDMQSNLYTSSRAMHSAILGLLQVLPPAYMAVIAPIHSCHAIYHGWVWLYGFDRFIPLFQASLMP